MLYKFIDEHTIKRHNGGYVVLGDTIYTNPKEDILRDAGYKDLEHTEIPEYDPKTQYLEATYKSGKTITVTYKIHNIEVEDEWQKL